MPNGKEDKDSDGKNKKAFRITPGQAQDAMKIIVGTKTNATIRDLEEEEGELEEKTGTVVSIDRDKINGNGWTIQDEEGNTYKCSCASNMYELPASTERHGVLYPNQTVTVKFTINPVLRTNTITEINFVDEKGKAKRAGKSQFDTFRENKKKKQAEARGEKYEEPKDDTEEGVLDIAKWRHEDEATTIIAKPMSAISVSNSKITFNYNNTNTVLADEESVATEGAKTKIDTKKLDINSDEIKIQDQLLEDYIIDYSIFNLLAYDSTSSVNVDEYGIDILLQSGMGQIAINRNLELYANERIVADLKNPVMFPNNRLRYPLLSDDDVFDLNIYPNGLVTIGSRGNPGPKDILSTVNWLTSPYGIKNVITVNVGKMCDCCSDISGQKSYLNYCPKCGTWKTLYEVNYQIKCSTCNTTYCEACGHDISVSCSNSMYNLKEYDQNVISDTATSCNYCEAQIPTGDKKEYANWCPYCHQWGYLHVNEDKESKKTLECTYCNKSFCLNCGVLQDQTFVNSYIQTPITFQSYKDFVEKNDIMNFNKAQFTRVL